MSPAMLAALQASDLQPAIFVQLQFVTATVYIWSGIGSISWNGQTWQGLGQLLSISPAGSAPTVEARGITIVLSGLDATLLPDCLNEFQLGLPVTCYLGLFSGGSLIADPLATWQGRMDKPTFNISGEALTISLNCENRLIDMNVAVDRRYTIQDAQMDYPGDLGFMFVASIQEKTLFLAGQANTTNVI